MEATSARRRVPHGVAGLLVVLFALTGVAFSYGLGHAPPLRLCAAHPGPATAPMTVIAQDSAAHAPAAPAHPATTDSCLALALLTLLVLGLAGRPRYLATRPRRHGWTLRPPALRVLPPRPLTLLLVLRL